MSVSTTGKCKTLLTLTPPKSNEKREHMKKIIILIIVLATSQITYSQDKGQTTIEAKDKPMKTLHDFKARTIDGKEFDMGQLKGKKVLVVNTASQCGLTPQYENLEALYEKFGGEKFTIIGFPANNFGGQEPGSNEEIVEFCKKNYGVSFQMMEKISVKGKDISPIYQWHTKKEQNGVIDAPITWDFRKFLIDEKGELVTSVSPRENPLSEEIINWIKSN